MALLNWTTNNCQLLLIACLLVTVNNAAISEQIKKKDSAIAIGEIKSAEAEQPPLAQESNSKTPKAIQEAVASTTKKANADGGEVKANVEKEVKQKLPNPPLVDGTIAPLERWNNIADESQFNLKETNYDYEDDELPQSFITSFYILIALSVGAMLFILVKVYRLRLSRAERKYGVQGDRSTQELVPLPVSIEDCNSEDEDQTLFEVNRRQIRIL